MDELASLAKFFRIFSIFVGAPFIACAAIVPGCSEVAQFWQLVWAVVGMASLGFGHSLLVDIWPSPTTAKPSDADGDVE